MTKLQWQRKHRQAFKHDKGYSTSANYHTGGLRAAVLMRDEHRCVQCAMTEAEHLMKWGRPITIDHRDKNQKNNTMENLQTLCLCCHGAKDLIPRLREPRLLRFKDFVIAQREAGRSCNSIAKELGFSCRVVTKWVRQWRKEDPLCQKQ